MNSSKSFFWLSLLFSLIIIPITTLADKEAERQKSDVFDAYPYEEIQTKNDENYAFKAIKSTRPGQKNRVYLWIGQSYQPVNSDAIVIEKLRKTGDIWFFDTPEATFSSRSRTEMRNMQGEFVAPLIQAAAQRYEDIIVITSDVAAVPTLRGLRHWQTLGSKTELNHLKSVVLLFPSLYVNTPAAGKPRELFPIAFETALPISIIQPELGAQTNFIDETIRALRMGGSLVQKSVMPQAIDDHYRWLDHQPMAELTARFILNATNKQLAQVKQLHYQIAQLSPSESLENPPESLMVRGLKKLDPPMKMPNIQLTDMHGNLINVQEKYQGKALLINFWATWCPHCVDEMPSMNKAQALLGEDKYQMVSVSYRDTQTILDEFVKEVTVDFPILMDSDGKISEQWKVFAFPSTFLVDRNGMIQYSINAGEIWDKEEMLYYQRKVIETPTNKP